MQNDNSAKIYDLALKLQALAEQGVGGERLNAIAKLKAICEKYNIDLSADIDKRTRHEYDIMLKHQRLFFAIVWHVIEDWTGTYYTPHAKRRILRLDVTELEHAEITYLFDLYVRDYDKQLRLFNEAFIVRNQLFAKHSKDYVEPKRSSKSITDDELDTIYMLAGAIRPTEVRRAIQQTN